MAQQVRDLTLETVADAFVEFMLVLQSQRSFERPFALACFGPVDRIPACRNMRRRQAHLSPIKLSQA